MAIKLLDNSARFEVVSQYDDAIDGKTDEGNAAFAKYLESLDEADLKYNEASPEPATKFLVRCLTSNEQAALQTKHMIIDTVAKKTSFRDGYSKYLYDVFETACLGIKKSGGELLKVSVEDVGMLHAMSIGSSISMLTTLGKNLKNV